MSQRRAGLMGRSQATSNAPAVDFDAAMQQFAEKQRNAEGRVTRVNH
jgi:hypothetical protein